ncbi:MAG: type II toxin-antitoxin system VapC family toxin [Gemmatimonadaceae bacterium]|nr:type II toxin-antitoxin system VapC family toxin [Gemmatimonadaceae bacterium]
MIVPDVNLLLYATNRDVPQHERALRWLTDLMRGDEPVGFSWFVLVGFVRIATNARVYRAPITLAQALSTVDGWLGNRLVTIIEPSSAHWEILRDLLRESGTAGNLTNDAHLAALCIERGATLHSADGDFSRFRGLRWANPLRAF